MTGNENGRWHRRLAFCLAVHDSVLLAAGDAVRFPNSTLSESSSTESSGAGRVLLADNTKEKLHINQSLMNIVGNGHNKTNGPVGTGTATGAQRLHPLVAAELLHTAKMQHAANIRSELNVVKTIKQQVPRKVMYLDRFPDEDTQDVLEDVYVMVLKLNQEAKVKRSFSPYLWLAHAKALAEELNRPDILFAVQLFYARETFDLPIAEGALLGLEEFRLVSSVRVGREGPPKFVYAAAPGLKNLLNETYVRLLGKQNQARALELFGHTSANKAKSSSRKKHNDDSGYSNSSGTGSNSGSSSGSGSGSSSDSSDSY